MGGGVGPGRGGHGHRLRQDDRDGPRRRPSRGTGRDQLDATILPAAYFALWAQRRMHDHGTTPETFAAIAAKNWNHGALCPWSDRQPDHTVTVEEVLASRMVAEPLTAMMVCPVDDGAACVHPRLHRVGEAPPARPAPRATGRVGAAQRDLLARATPSSVRSSARRRCRATPPCLAYEDAGLGPDDIDLALCHDAFANEELEYYELLGFCPDGEGDKLVAEGATALGGRIPFNTDGGLIARGHPAGRPAWRWCTRSCSSCAARPAPRQVEGARTAPRPPRGRRQRLHRVPVRSRLNGVPDG